MSGYLDRLVSRSRGAGEVQPLQPFVRSASPVAERDQRIGMTGFQGFEFGEPLLAEADSGAVPERADPPQSAVPPEITASAASGGTNVQRKVANPTTRLTGSAISPSHQAASLPSVAQDATDHAKGSMPSGRDVGNPLQVDFRSEVQSRSRLPIEEYPVPTYPPAARRGEPTVSPNHDDMTDIERGASSTRNTRLEAPSASDSQSVGEPSKHSVGAAGMRPGRHMAQAGSTRLEPSARALAERHPSRTEGDSSPASDVKEDPRIVIGRINVEVVPPPAAQASTTASRPGPLSAASASVIGPLDTGIRPNVRLSLRHR